MIRSVIAVLAVVCVSLVATAEQAVNPPPQPLKKVGDHWTPYEPPQEFAADAEVYTIQPGDTLWDLARKFLGDPYLWPQLWERNQYIRDAHWIYPGDPLVIGVQAEEAAPEPPAPEPEPMVPEPTPEPEPAGPPADLVTVGSEDDIYCFAYLDDQNEQVDLSMPSAQDMEYKHHFVTGDIVYLNEGSEEGIAAGQEYFLVLPAGELHHPATGAVLGTVKRYMGQARVLCAQDHTAIAEIMSSCDGVPLDAELKPFEPIPVPMTVLTPPATCCDAPSGKLTGYITYSRDKVEVFGEGHAVMIDVGEADRVGPGTVLTIFRDNPVQGMPRLVLGELAVLTAGDHWATAMVLSSSAPLSVGDRVELK